MSTSEYVLTHLGMWLILAENPMFAGSGILMYPGAS